MKEIKFLNQSTQSEVDLCTDGNHAFFVRDTRIKSSAVCCFAGVKQHNALTKLGFSIVKHDPCIGIQNPIQSISIGGGSFRVLCAAIASTR